MNWYCSYFQKDKFKLLEEDVFIVHNIRPDVMSNCNSAFINWIFNTNKRTTDSFIDWLLHDSYHTSRLAYTGDQFDELYPEIIPLCTQV